MSARVACQECGYENSLHRLNCKKCRATLSESAKEEAGVVQSPAEKVGAAKRHIKAGGMSFVLGLVLLVVTLANDGDIRLTTWGIMIGGGITLLWGFVKYVGAS